MTLPPAVVSIDYDGQVTANGKVMASLKELGQRGSRMSRMQPNQTIVVYADRRARYKPVAVNLAAPQRRGVQRLAIGSISD